LNPLFADTKRILLPHASGAVHPAGFEMKEFAAVTCRQSQTAAAGLAIE